MLDFLCDILGSPTNYYLLKMYLLKMCTTGIDVLCLCTCPICSSFYIDLDCDAELKDTRRSAVSRSEVKSVEATQHKLKKPPEITKCSAYLSTEIIPI